MRILIVDSKTGFDVRDVYTPINIRDERGLLFYSTEGLLPKVTKFNLPKGKYYVDSGNFAPSLLVRSYGPVKMPPRERFFYPDPTNYTVIFRDNPNKCEVDWNNEQIIFDKSFEEKPLPQVHFIMYHEFGHRFYGTEKYCDLYAKRCMLSVGYNPSQIGEAQIDSLSDKQIDRKNFIINSF